MSPSRAHSRAGARLSAALILGCLASLLATPAEALDVQLDADTSFQAYEVRSPGSGTFMARRRLLSNLGLRVSQPLGEPTPDGRVPRLTAEARLRLEQDFGETCLLDRELCLRATDASDPGAFQPLAADTRIDVPTLFAQVDGLPLGLAARLGRQLLLDPMGFARFDGLGVSIAPLHFLRAEAHAGLLVRETSFAGTDRSDPQGSIRLDAQGRDVPWAAPPSDTWMVGAAVEGGPGRVLQLRLAFRHMWDDDGQVISRVLASASSHPIEGFRVDAHGVFDLLTDEVIDAAGVATIGDGRPFSLRLSVERHVPRFDPGTIWAWFTVAPIHQARAGARLVLSPFVELGGGLKGRHADLGEGPDEELDAGGDAYLQFRVEGFRVSTNGFLWTGSLGPSAGVGLDIARPVLDFLELSLHLSLWHFDDPLRANQHGTVLSEALGARIRITPETMLYLELQHATSRTIGHRFRGMIAVRIDTWR